MTNTKLRINDFDWLRLKKMADTLDPVQSEALKQLLAKFKRAQIIKHHETPPGLVTMNSQVAVKNKITKEVRVVTLVFPGQEENHDAQVSLLDPIGKNLLGRGIGETVMCPSEQGSVWLNIESVPYQPENAGDFHL